MANRRDLFCQNCGTVARPRTRVRGSFLIEVFLWLCLIIPGVVYSLWRVTTKEKVCPQCGAGQMIPLDSPRAKAALERPRE
jgi:ribosomal protein S27AE